jgi:nitrate reductase gamma subunit
MFQDTVLVGGAGFLLSGGVIWLLLRRISSSSMTERSKRMLNYLLMGILVAVAIYIIDWHSSNYKDKYSVSELRLLGTQTSPIHSG